MKTVAYGILTTIITGLIVTAIGVYNDVESLKADVIQTDKAVDKMEKKVDDIHWFLIRKNGTIIKKQR